MTIAPFDPLFGGMSRGEIRGSGAADDPEFRLLSKACQSTFDRSASGLVAEIAGRPIDWARFLRLARFHRVEGLAWRGLEEAGASVPAPAREEMHDLAQRTALANLAMVAKCVDILADFQAAGVPILFVKGLTLAAIAYGDIAAKASADVDILVHPRDIGRAAALLEAAGFALTMPASRHRQRIDRWHRLNKESSWFEPATGIGIDLHSALSDNRALISSIGMQSEPRRVEIAAGIALPTLPPDDLAAYLAVHGSGPAWVRLKWICDFAALLRSEHEGKIGELYGRMRRLGAGHAADQALLLADELFGSLASEPGLRRSLKASRINRRLVSIAWHMLGAGREPVEPTSVTLGTLPMHYSQFLLRGDPTYLGAEFAKIGRIIARRLRFRS